MPGRYQWAVIDAFFEWDYITVKRALGDARFFFLREKNTV
jgi:hypothetical protein